MIRDPSDGSVREAPKAENPIKPVYDSPEKAAEAAKWYRVVPDTGIRQPVKTDAQERLERSREWLKNYHARKDEPHARGDFSGEDSKDGHSGDDQGQAESGISGRADHGAHRQG